MPSAPPERPYILVNMVMSADGKAAVDGTEQGIGSATDRRLMRELRVNADVVLTGAGTLRASGTSSRLGDEALEQLRLDRGKPRFPVAAVFSRSGDLPLDRAFFTARDFDAVVYASPGMSEPRYQAIAATGRPVFRLPSEGAQAVSAMLTHMRRELRAEVLLCEGGPTTNAQLFELGVVDEYFLTLGPVIVGGKATLTAVDGDRAFSPGNVKRMDLISAAPNPATSEVYLRYRVRR